MTVCRPLWYRRVTPDASEGMSDERTGGRTESERLVVVTQTNLQASRLTTEPVDDKQHPFRAMRGFLRGDSGQDLAEYAILASLIALVVIGAVTLLGTQLVAAYNNIVAQLPFPGGGS